LPIVTKWNLSVPLETATYINQLVSSNPAHSDGLNNADAHMRLIKSTIQATLPNFTAVALSSTQAQIDAATAAVGTSGVTLLSEAGVNFATNTGDGFTNPAAGEIDVKVGGSVLAKFLNSTTTFSTTNISASGNVTVGGTLTVTGAITGPGIVPIGASLMWFTDTLPAAGPNGTYAWANGGTLSRTTYAALFALFNTTYGAGDGSTTFNVPNLQEVAPVGKSTMGGASSPGLLPSIASGLKTVLGSLFGLDTNTLSSANLPPHNHSVFLKETAHSHAAHIATTNNVGGSSFAGPTGANPLNPAGGTSLGNTDTATTGMTIGSVSGTANDNQTAAGPGTSTAVNNVQPTRVVNWIIRVA
jgi:microcystin-dependent protein